MRNAPGGRDVQAVLGHHGAADAPGVGDGAAAGGDNSNTVPGLIVGAAAAGPWGVSALLFVAKNRATFSRWQRRRSRNRAMRSFGICCRLVNVEALYQDNSAAAAKWPRCISSAAAVNNQSIGRRILLEFGRRVELGKSRLSCPSSICVNLDLESVKLFQGSGSRKRVTGLSRQTALAQACGLPAYAAGLHQDSRNTSRCRDRVGSRFQNCPSPRGRFHPAFDS